MLTQTMRGQGRREKPDFVESLREENLKRCYAREGTKDVLFL